MPKLKAGVSVAATFFNINGVDYLRGNYEVVYRNNQGSPPDTVEDSLLEVGLRQKYTGENLVGSTHYSNWTDSTDTPYASLTALLTAMNTVGVFSV